MTTRVVDVPARSFAARRRRGLTLLGALLASVPPGALSAQHLDAELVRDLSWRMVGPAAIGGRIVDVDVDASHTTTLFAAAATGGLWRSRNNGTTWQCIFEDEGTISIGDIAVDPTNADVIWIGSGEANNQRSAYWGDGVYKTTDGGKTWINTGLSDSHHIARVVIDPRDPNVVYVAAMGHQYTTNDQRGVYKTSDGGRTWKRKLRLGAAIGVTDLLIDPAAPDRLYAAAHERLRRPWHYDGEGPGSAIHRSLDGGETWTRLAGGLPGGEIGRIGLDLCRSKPNIVYAVVPNENPRPAEPVVDGKPRLGLRGQAIDGGVRVTEVLEQEAAARAGIAVGDVITRIGEVTVAKLSDLLTAMKEVKTGDRRAVVLLRDGAEQQLELTFGERPADVDATSGTIGGEIYRSEDAGDTWVKTNEQPVSGDPAYYYGQIRVDPNDDQRVFVLGIPMFKSTDGGKTFARDGASSLHSDHHALWIDPHNSERMLLGNDGGLAMSYDRGATWDHINNLPIAQFYTVAVDMAQPYNIYGGTQDNGSWQGPSRTRGGGASHIHWRRVGGGDGFYVQVDPEQNRVAFVESQFGALQRLDLESWRRASIQPAPEDGQPGYRFNWSSPILMSSHNPRLIYFGGNRLFRSLDNGEHWRPLGDDLSTADADRIAGNVPHCTITTIAESPFDADRLLVGTDDGNVQWSDDGGHSFRRLSGCFPGLPAALWVSRVEFSRHDEQTAYVAFTGYREDDFAPYVYRTRDGGEMWESIAGNLPPGPLNVVREDPRRRDVLYVGSDLGVFASIDGGARWTELGNGLPTLPVHDLVVHPRDRELVAGTHGQGFFVIDIAPLQELSAEVLAGEMHLFGVKDVIRWRRRGEPSVGFDGDRIWQAPQPDNGAVLWCYAREAHAEGALVLEVLDAAGGVIRKLDVPEAAGLHRIAWDLRGEPAAGGDDAAGEGNRRRRPRTVDNGSYTARLTLGEQTQSVSFALRGDPLDAGDAAVAEAEVDADADPDAEQTERDLR